MQRDLRYSDIQNNKQQMINRNNTSQNVEVKKGKKTKARAGTPDGYFLFLVFVLVAIGLIMILSSSSYRGVERHGDGYYFFSRQAKWTAVGFFAMFVLMNIKYTFVRKMTKLGYGVSILLLIAVFAIGTVTKGAVRWIQIGSFTFQPSEVAKITTIAMLALMLEKRSKVENASSLKWKDFFKEYAVIFIPAGLILIENISTSIVLVGIGFAILFTAGLKVEKFAIFVGVPAIILLIMFIRMGGVDKIKHIADGKYESRLERLDVWLDPWVDPKDKGFQVIQSLYAIGSGGIFGVGLGKSKQKLGYIPEAHNDIIFPIICEEFGLVGAVFLLTLFMMLISRGVWIAVHAPDKFSAFFTIGVMALIGIQVVVNVAVVTNVIPATGMPLPFISYGGTSLFCLLVSIGIILNISRYTIEV